MKIETKKAKKKNKKSQLEAETYYINQSEQGKDQTEPEDDKSSD